MGQIYVKLDGRCAFDGEMKQSRGGSEYARLRVAVSGKPKPGEQYGPTTWVNVLGFKEMAQTVAGFRKGDIVEVAGRAEVSTYTDQKTGEVRVSLDVMADEARIFERPQQGQGRAQHQTRQTAQPRTSGQRAAQRASDAVMDDDLSDLPF